ncbi:MAG TPA: hypothetical protein VN381_14945, partial [Anaerovoracaceae bacterium]|nr:hypothetical protein [Anaerovoracaceae bacterium]
MEECDDMTFEESCRNYFDQEYPELAIKRIDTNEIAVYHSELSIGYSILINGKNHNVNSPDDVKRCIDFAAVKWKNKFNTLGTSGYQYKNMVEILIQCGEEPMYRELSSLLEADAAHYFAHDSTETYEIERLSKLEESCPFYHLRQFWIGDIEAKIGKPSDVFRMLMSPYIQYHGMPKESFDKLFSLKLFGVDKQNFMGYISQALFIINQEYSCEQYPSVGGMDDWIAANNQYAQKLYTNGYNHYPEAVPAEPFFLYNAGKTAFSAQESFLYHYRVFEFFLYTLNTSKLIDLLQKYD